MLSNYNNKVEPGRDSNRERGRKADRQAEKRREGDTERDSKRKQEKLLPVAKREAAAVAEIEQAYNKSCS